MITSVDERPTEQDAIQLSTTNYQLYINGEWRDASDGATIASENPATGQHLATIAEATKGDVDAAVAAARAAFPG